LHQQSAGVRSIAAQLLGISLPLLITSGLAAYIISSWLLVLVRLLGITSYSPRLYWACSLFGSVRGAALFAGRITRAVGLSILVPLVYALVFEITGNAELPIGAIVGVVHALLVGVALPIVAMRSGCAKAPAPGLFGWRLGAATPLVVLLVYAVYGATLGYVYVVVAP
jgi:hypothetical protein